MIIYGIHAVKNALNYGNVSVSKIYTQKNKRFEEWIPKALASKICYVDAGFLDQMVGGGAVHQGIAIEVDGYCYFDIEDLREAGENCSLAILDGVTDPQNFGAIIRSAACFGISGIVVSARGACNRVTGAVVKAASGGLDHTRVYLVKNLSAAIDKLKSYGFWIVSFCESGDKWISEIDLKGKTAMILGSEGSGIRRLQRENSDFVIKLPTKQYFPTLNVSNSAAIAFYETAKQNGFNL